jgi:hypothetical protein
MDLDRLEQIFLIVARQERIFPFIDLPGKLKMDGGA